MHLSTIVLILSHGELNIFIVNYYNILCILIYIYVCSIIYNIVSALESGLLLRNDCSCPGYNLTFECTVNGGIGGSTVWIGEVFHNTCMIPHLVLRHRYFMQGISQACNDDDVILRAYSLQVEAIDSEHDYSSYTSQLNVTYSTSLIGSTVVCAYDNGTQVTHIGSQITTTKCRHNNVCMHAGYFTLLIMQSHQLLASI
jgi:hypothetical protein